MQNTETFWLQRIRELQRTTANIHQVIALFVDSEGRQITEPHNGSPLCQRIVSSKVGWPACEACVRQLVRQASVPPGSSILKTCHAGLTEFAVPVRLENRIVGYFIVGGAAIRRPSSRRVAAIAQALELDTAELLEAARNVPLWNRKHLEELARHLEIVLATVVELASTHEKLEGLKESLTSLMKLSQHFSSSLEVKEVSRQALEALVAYTGACSGSIAVYPTQQPETVAIFQPDQTSVSAPAHGILAEVKAKGQPVRFESKTGTSATGEKVQPAISMPLVARDNIVGVLTLAGHPEQTQEWLSSETEYFLSIVGVGLGLALDNARLYKELEKRKDLLEQLVEIGKELSESLDPQVVMDRAIRRAAEVLGADFSAIRLMDRERGYLVLTASLRTSDGLSAPVDLLPPESGIIEQVFKYRGLVAIEDITKAPSELNLSHMAREVRAVAAVPIEARGEVMGVLEVYSCVPRSWTDDQLNYLTIIASQAGLALDNARLYKSMREHYASAVRALAAALEAKDPYTRGHSHRVALLARACAREMGLSAEEQEEIHTAGLLHDVGKIGVSEHILLKPGPLEPGERKEIETHPIVGAKILEPAGFSPGVVAVARYHHENYDGSGYPQGMANGSIPLLARIIRVVDSFDAMISRRPYREPLTVQHALTELSRCAGRQFDPAVVEAFFRIPEDEIKGIAAAKSSEIPYHPR